MGNLKRPGRPSNGDTDNRRESLILTAAKLFSSKGYAAVSLKEISEAANVTPAMVSYYFEGKSGLLNAVMELAASMLFELSQKIIAESEDETIISAYAQNHLSFMAEHSWIIPLITREVLSKDSEPRDSFLEALDAKALPILAPRVLEEMSDNRIRSDLDPNFIQLSLISMTIFPFVAAPILGPLYGYKVDEGFVEAYSAHIKTLFLEGVTPIPTAAVEPERPQKHHVR